LRDPVVTIQLKEFEKPYFIAGGEVGHPGKYDLRGDTTAIQAVAIAGGFTEASKHSRVYLFRRVSNDWVETQKLDMKKMLAAGNLGEDMHLRPGDMLYVPRNTATKIKRFLPTATLATYFGPIL
jgi:polysaccharide export outer membrane protein